MDISASHAKQLTLLVDKTNLLAQSLAANLAKQGSVVVVSQQPIQSDEDIIFVPYVSLLPQIPDGLYSKIILVWEEKHSHLLEPLLQKSKEQNIEFFIVTTEEEKGSLPDTLSSAIVLVLGDLFDNRREFPFTKFLQEVKAKKYIRLSNMGLHEWYPVLFSDVVDKISELIFAKAKEHKKYFIGPRHPYTALTIAHKLQKIDPDIRIDFLGEKEPYIREQKYPSAFSQYDSLAKIQNIFQDLSIREKTEAKEIAKVVFAKQKKKKTKASGWLYGLYVLLIIFFLPVAITFGSGGVGAFLLTSGINDARRGEFALSLTKISAAEKNFSLAKESSEIVVKEMQIIGQQHASEFLQKKIVAGQNIAQLTAGGIVFSQSLTAILQGKTLSPETEGENLTANLQKTEVMLQSLSNEDIPQQYQQAFSALQQLDTVVSGIGNNLPQVLGVTTKKTYLVLFQNNMELRPGGGFIGSYGILRLDRGAIKQFSIHDVYDADGQLKGHIEPPFALRRYIPIVHLYLRDSNFDPDFTINGQKAAFILSQETGEKVDGVIGIDLETLRTLLSGTGGVYVPSYNQTVTDKNFFMLLEEHAEKNFFPGSTQKKDFLQSFATSFLAKLQNKSQVNILALMPKVVGLLQGKHILASFADPALQSSFSFAGLSSSLTDTRASSSGIFSDFAGVVEANLGVNKANAFVTREVSHEVVITQSGDEKAAMTLTLHNSSSGTWPGGVYRNYIRFLLPSQAVLSSVTLDNVSQQIVAAVTTPAIYEAKSFTVPKGLEVTKETESGKTLYGFLVTVPVKGSLTIQINYTISHAFQLSKQKQVYDLLMWKQAGIDEFPYNLSLTIPEGFTFLSSSMPISKNGQSATYQTTIAKDTDFTISFAQE